MRPFPEYRVRAKLGRDALIVDTNPTRIAGKIRDMRLRRIWLATRNSKLLPGAAGAAVNHLARAMRPFNMTGDGIDLVHFESGATYQRMQDIWTHRNALKDSKTYQQIAGQLGSEGVYQHKNYKITQRDEIIALLRTCFLDLLDSMARDAYLRDKTSTYGTGGIGKAVIWRDGRLRHENGATHRLAAARIVGTQSAFPLRIVGIHRDWLKDQGITRHSDVPKLPKVIRSFDGVLSGPSPNASLS